MIRDEEETAEEGSAIHVDMNGSVVVPGYIFDSIRGRNITVTFDMGEGILWSVNGKDIVTEKTADIDFSVKRDEGSIPVDIVNRVTGENSGLPPFYPSSLAVRMPGIWRTCTIIMKIRGNWNGSVRMR